MSARYRCPGVAGRGFTATVIHDLTCCQRFAKLAPWQQARDGLRDVSRRRDTRPREELPKPPVPEEISMAQLAALVEKMIARAARFPDEEPPGASAHVYYVDGEHTLDDVHALMDLGRPYNLVVGYRRYRTPPTEGES